MSLAGPGDMSLTQTPSYLAPPVLEDNGSNFVVWRARQLTAFGARKGVMRHVLGQARRPADLVFDSEISDYRFSDGRLASPSDTEIEAFEGKVDDYEQREAIIKQQLFATISNSLVIELSSLKKASEVWNAILARYRGKSEIFKMNVYRQLTNLKCNGEDRVRDYLAKASTLR